jgi:hypothetical protein
VLDPQPVGLARRVQRVAVEQQPDEVRAVVLGGEQRRDPSAVRLPAGDPGTIEPGHLGGGGQQPACSARRCSRPEERLAGPLRGRAGWRGPPGARGRRAGRRARRARRCRGRRPAPWVSRTGTPARPDGRCRAAVTWATGRVLDRELERFDHARSPRPSCPSRARWRRCGRSCRWRRAGARRPRRPREGGGTRRCCPWPRRGTSSASKPWRPRPGRRAAHRADRRGPRRWRGRPSPGPARSSSSTSAGKTENPPTLRRSLLPPGELEQPAREDPCLVAAAEPARRRRGRRRRGPRTPRARRRRATAAHRRCRAATGWPSSSTARTSMPGNATANEGTGRVPTREGGKMRTAAAPDSSTIP